MSSRTAPSPLLLLHPEDNVFVARRTIREGEKIAIDGREIRMSAAIPLGHKVARFSLQPGCPVLKYGASIGSATSHVAPGEHVHLHNMKSDYLPAPTPQALARES